MKNIFSYLQASLILNCFTLLAVVLSILSCDKKKQIYIKNTDNTTAIYKMVKKGDSLNHVSEYDSAIFYFNKAQLLCNPKIDYANQYVYSLSQIGFILQRSGDYYGSENILTKTLPYLKYTSKPRLSQIVYNITANNYYNTYDNDNALLYHKKALKIAISQFRKAQIKCDIAFIYMQQKKYLEAINLLEPLAKKKTEDKTDAVNSEIQYSAVLYNLGLCYLRLGNHEKQALDNLTKSLEITLKTNDNFELIGCYHALYLYYKKYNNPELKKYHAMNGYISACKANSISNQINSLGEVIEAEDGENLKKYVKIYLKLTDSIHDAHKRTKNQSSTIKFLFKKDKEENLELKTQKAENDLQLQRQKNRSYISYVIISLSVLILLFLIFHITSKSKREKDDAIFKSEMRISNKLHNELNSDVFQTLLFAEDNDLEDKENKEKLLDKLNNIYLKTRNISRENSKIPIDYRYVSALKEMISEYKTEDVNILLNGFDTIAWDAINKNKKIILYRVLQELLFNMKKFNSSSLVSIIVKTTHKNLAVSYTDNSNEITSKNIILEKRLQNVENRIKTIKGTINFDKSLERGFKLSFTFPI
ncbi:hypothetical protein [Flavobacterium sp. ACN6]|uniref:ATP-binding protein n=1 Tax=Flavobacterium sp. ACN6 TaxID=1920426 RepID=UPI000BB367FA|nr:hypothetical protein [Flavobacterium sp. ACN6]PBJ13592.1 sensory histidine kinase UhpB [Flavobacterium sp. ACN6]